MNDYIKPSVNLTTIKLTIDDLTFDDLTVDNSIINENMRISNTFEGNTTTLDEYIEDEINALLKKYDLSLEGLEAFIEKYEPERLI